LNRQQHIQEVAAIQRRYETKYFPIVKRAIQLEIDRVISIIKSHGVDEARRYITNHLDSKQIPGVISGLYQEVGLRFARRQWMDFNKQKAKSRVVVYDQKRFGFSQQWADAIQQYLREHLTDKITFGIAETTREGLLNVLNESINKGWGIDQTVQALEGLPLSGTQAARIVRTEITRASNAGIYSAGATNDFEQTKEWISAHDNRTRGNKPQDHASHVAFDGQTINYEDYFVDQINGDYLRFPGDPIASAASTINCRCVIALVIKVDARGRAIPKTRVRANITIMN